MAKNENDTAYELLIAGLDLLTYPKDSPAHARYQMLVVEALNGQEKYQEALALMQQFLPILESQPQREQTQMRINYVHGVCYLGLGQLQKAEKLLLESFQFYRKQIGLKAFTTQRVLAKLVTCYEQMGDQKKRKQFQALVSEIE